MDLFRFWSQVGRGEKVHPADREVLRRVKHGFDLRCLPGCFFGPLRTARVVLLYLSPGFDEYDLVEAKSQKGRNRVFECRKGNQPLPGPQDHFDAWKWWRSRTADFGEWEQLRSSIAVLNIGAYHSTGFNDQPLLAALPSSRMSLSWAQSVLFPQAIKGERIVVCLRSHKYWGLEAGRKYGKALFSPKVSRGGHIEDEGPLRDQITRAVRKALLSDAK